MFIQIILSIYNRKGVIKRRQDAYSKLFWLPMSNQENISDFYISWAVNPLSLPSFTSQLSFVPLIHLDLSGFHCFCPCTLSISSLGLLFSRPLHFHLQYPPFLNVLPIMPFCNIFAKSNRDRYFLLHLSMIQWYNTILPQFRNYI